MKIFKDFLQKKYSLEITFLIYSLSSSTHTPDNFQGLSWHQSNVHSCQWTLYCTDTWLQVYSLTRWNLCFLHHYEFPLWNLRKQLKRILDPTKPRYLTQNSLELKSWSRRKVTADSTKNKTIRETYCPIHPFLVFLNDPLTRYVERYFTSVKKVRRKRLLACSH